MRETKREHGDDHLDSALALASFFFWTLGTASILKIFNEHLSILIPATALTIILVVKALQMGVVAAAYAGLVSAFFFNFMFAEPVGQLHFESRSSIQETAGFILLALAVSLFRNDGPIQSALRRANELLSENHREPAEDDLRPFRTTPPVP